MLAVGLLFSMQAHAVSPLPLRKCDEGSLIVRFLGFCGFEAPIW
jgi:hypothetical protein